MERAEGAGQIAKHHNTPSGNMHITRILLIGFYMLRARTCAGANIAIRGPMYG